MRYLVILLFLSGCGTTTILPDEMLTTQELKKRNYYIKPSMSMSNHARLIGSVNDVRRKEPKEKGTVLTPFPD